MYSSRKMKANIFNYFAVLVLSNYFHSHFYFLCSSKNLNNKKPLSNLAKTEEYFVVLNF